MGALQSVTVSKRLSVTVSGNILSLVVHSSFGHRGTMCISNRIGNGIGNIRYLQGCSYSFSLNRCISNSIGNRLCGGYPLGQMDIAKEGP